MQIEYVIIGFESRYEKKYIFHCRTVLSTVLSVVFNYSIILLTSCKLQASYYNDSGHFVTHVESRVIVYWFSSFSLLLEQVNWRIFFVQKTGLSCFEPSEKRGSRHRSCSCSPITFFLFWVVFHSWRPIYLLLSLPWCLFSIIMCVWFELFWGVDWNFYPWPLANRSLH